MYVHTETLKDGSKVYRFTYFKEGKRVRLSVKDHPKFTTRKDAEEWAKTQSAYHSMMKANIEKRITWQKKYYNFTELLTKFETYYRNKAPNSYKNTLSYLRNYILPFFLNEKDANNVNMWHLLFPHFRDWLETANLTRGKDKVLAGNTKNNIIISLNAFLSYLAEYSLMSKESAVKCKALPEHLLYKRSFKDVISVEEMRLVYTKMSILNKAAAELFLVLFHTGMRFSELFGLPITALHKGIIPNIGLVAELIQHRIEYYGYLYLDSQPFHDSCIREPDKSLKRKPLKSRKVISPKHARIIPIESKEVWNILAVRYRQGVEDHKQTKYTTNREDYRFFDDLEYNKAVNTMRQAYIDLGLPPKSYHCTRHSFTTQLVGRTRSFFLVRSITGHSKDHSFLRYVHIWEEMGIAASAASQDIEEIS